jgi:hypothetical protein
MKMTWATLAWTVCPAEATSAEFPSGHFGSVFAKFLFFIRA